MVFKLGPGALAGGYRLAAYDTIGSTSAEAMERGRAGDPVLLWIAALAQTAGIGRRGRSWSTPSGNLAASLLVPAGGAPADAAKLGFVAGLALEAAIGSVAPQVAVRMAFDGADGEASRLRLKWPNDVLVDGAKVAGILLQGVSAASGGDAVVVGFGVNVRHAPEGLPYPATSLAACGADISAEALFEALSDSWVEQAAAWADGRGFPTIRRRWLDRAAGIGAPIAVTTGGEVLRGIFETIDDNGMLVVSDANGVSRRIAAGDVHFGIAATARR